MAALCSALILGPSQMSSLPALAFLDASDTEFCGLPSVGGSPVGWGKVLFPCALQMFHRESPNHAETLKGCSRDSLLAWIRHQGRELVFMSQPGIGCQVRSRQSNRLVS